MMVLGCGYLYLATQASYSVTRASVSYIHLCINVVILSWGGGGGGGGGYRKK